MDRGVANGASCPLARTSATPCVPEDGWDNQFRESELASPCRSDAQWNPVSSSITRRVGSLPGSDRACECEDRRGSCPDTGSQHHPGRPHRNKPYEQPSAMAEQQPTTPAFKPTALQLRYREARAMALADGRPFTDAVLA